MRLSQPSLMTLLVSVLLAVAALLAQAGIVHVPVVSNAPFATFAVGYLVLLAGILVRGL